MITQPSLEVGGPGAFGYYENSFSAFTPISWSGRTWHTTPFGACYSVWAQVGTDPLTTSFGTGWVGSTLAGQSNFATLTLPAGWSTVYFPIIKNTGTFPVQSSTADFAIHWKSSTGAITTRGWMSLNDIENSGVYGGYTPGTYSAMVYPVLCYGSVARTVQVCLTRTLSGPEVWVGRPVVLPGACSWFRLQ